MLGRDSAVRATRGFARDPVSCSLRPTRRSWVVVVLRDCMVLHTAVFSPLHTGRRPQGPREGTSERKREREMGDL